LSDREVEAERKRVEQLITEGSGKKEVKNLLKLVDSVDAVERGLNLQARHHHAKAVDEHTAAALKNLQQAVSKKEINEYSKFIDAV
jgi:hypothetical protein